ncbi:MAG: hypothetical protein VKN72_11695 [Nostocales cyanobacterium 94392]|nr:hypothetical protein [Nostocales cyanobacterium 94392]
MRLFLLISEGGLPVGRTTFESQGMHIGSFRNITGILSANPIHVEQHQVNPVNEIFADEAE